MSKPWEEYEELVVETYFAVKSGKTSRIHVRPVSGQAYSTDADVECSRSMRLLAPIGSKFKVYAKLTDREGGKDFLYSHHSWPLELIERAEGPLPKSVKDP
ncbi:MAG: hypothetical protein VYD64_09325 [Pseudomonadota bacterium]|nr:hypothetical protein [Pseudomonadota bacterium]MEC9369198.1 hypothetical protein [Pseudomonadota bacterium]